VLIRSPAVLLAGIPAGKQVPTPEGGNQEAPHHLGTGEPDKVGMISSIFQDLPDQEAGHPPLHR